MAVARSVAEKVIFLAPGMPFVPDRSAQPPAMRINAAYASDPRLIEFMRDRLNA
jgi:DNA-binding transcriptional MocR family regulator